MRRNYAIDFAARHTEGVLDLINTNSCLLLDEKQPTNPFGSDLGFLGAFRVR